MRREHKIEDLVRRVLEENDIMPFSITFTYELGGILSITVYTKDDYNMLLDFLDYPSICDKTGYTTFPEHNTILLTSMALVKGDKFRVI